MPLTKVVGHTLIMNEKCNLFSSFLIEILRKLALKVAIFDSECEAELRADAGRGLLLFFKPFSASRGTANRFLIAIAFSALPTFDLKASLVHALSTN